VGQEEKAKLLVPKRSRSVNSTAVLGKCLILELTRFLMGLLRCGRVSDRVYLKILELQDKRCRISVLGYRTAEATVRMHYVLLSAETRKVGPHLQAALLPCPAALRNIPTQKKSR
jgi:hypothetical protein